MPVTTGSVTSNQVPDTSNVPSTLTTASTEQVPQQTQQAPELVYQVTSDIIAGMKPKDIEKYYPELKGIDISIYSQLASDMEAGMPVNEAPKYYPEIFPPEVKQKAEQGFWSGVAEKTLEAAKGGIAK